jgi:hypothetical protein
MPTDDRAERHASFGQRREAVKRPGADERLRKRHVLEEDCLNAARLGGTPAKQRKRADDLETDFPLIALGERSDEDLLVRLYPVGMVVRQLSSRSTARCATSQSPSRVSETSSLTNEGNAPRGHGHDAMRDTAAIAAAEQRAKLRAARACRTVVHAATHHCTRSHRAVPRFGTPFAPPETAAENVASY